MRVLTRNKNSERAKKLAQLPNVELFEGQQTSQKDLHAGFKGAWGAWVNTDGFTIGEKNELFYGCRAYEIARDEGVKHYIYAATDFALKDTNWDETYHWGHNDAKGRVLDYISAQGQNGAMTSSSVITGPYMDMLYDGMFVPQEQEDGSLVWANPAGKNYHNATTTDCRLADDKLLIPRGRQNSVDRCRGWWSLCALDV